MANNITFDLGNKWLNLSFRNQAYTAPSTVYVALFTAAPSQSGGGTEVSGGSYARTAVTFAASASSVITNSGAAVTFPVASAGWGTVTHAAIMDASTAGNMMAWGALTSSVIVNSGSTAKFNTSQISVGIAA